MRIENDEKGKKKTEETSSEKRRGADSG